MLRDLGTSALPAQHEVVRSFEVNPIDLTLWPVDGDAATLLEAIRSTLDFVHVRESGERLGGDGGGQDARREAEVRVKKRLKCEGGRRGVYGELHNEIRWGEGDGVGELEGERVECERFGGRVEGWRSGGQSDDQDAYQQMMH